MVICTNVVCGRIFKILCTKSENNASLVTDVKLFSILLFLYDEVCVSIQQQYQLQPRNGVELPYTNTASVFSLQTSGFPASIYRNMRRSSKTGNKVDLEQLTHVVSNVRIKKGRLSKKAELTHIAQEYFRYSNSTKVSTSCMNLIRNSCKKLNVDCDTDYNNIEKDGMAKVEDATYETTQKAMEVSRSDEETEIQEVEEVTAPERRV